MSPTQLTLRELRKGGYLAAVVEHWNPHARIRQDLFGCIDVLAVGQAGGETSLTAEVLAVQATSGGNVSSRLRKLESPELSPTVATLLAAGWKVEVWGWRKSRRTNRWELRRVPVSASAAEVLTGATVEP